METRNRLSRAEQKSLWSGRAILFVLVMLGLALLMGRLNTTWAQPNQNSFRETIDTIVPTPTNGPTATGTARPGECVTRVLLRQNLEGYTGTADTWIYAWDPTWPQSRSMLRVKGGDAKSTLVRFDLTGKIPAGVEIVEAELMFFVESGERIRPLDVSAYRLLRSWEMNEATWNNATTSQAWGSPGANRVGVDRVGTPDDTVTLEYRAVYKGLDVTDSVRYWQQHPAENYGWLIKGASDSTGEFLLYSSAWKNEHSPLLRIDYTTCGITPTNTPTITPTGATGTSTITPTATGTPAQTDGLQVLVYEDTNHNGQQDAQEKGLAGVRVELLNLSWEVLNLVITGQDGTGLFAALPSGEYRLREINPPWYCSTTDDIIRVYHGTGQTVVTFGDYPCHGLALPLILKSEKPSGF